MLILKLKLKLKQNSEPMNIVNFSCFGLDSDLVTVVAYKHDK